MCVSPDLDESVRKDPRLLDKYLAEDSPSQPKLRSHSSYSSVVITTRPDGVRHTQSSVYMYNIMISAV